MQWDLDGKLFDRFQGLIAGRSGLHFDETRRAFLEAALRERARACGCPALLAYYNLLRSEGGQVEFRRLLELITIPETRFFRNQAHFQALQEQILPALAQSEQVGMLRLWSAGCSTGPEAYSLAISALEVLPGAPDRQVEVLGTDVSERALAVAERGLYDARAVQNVPPPLLEKYFHRSSEGFRVVDEVRQRVRFDYLNLLEEPFPLALVEAMHVVFCQNVTIYFQSHHTRQVVDRIYTVLKPGGYLFLGYSETLWGISDAFCLQEVGGAMVYQKLDPERQGSGVPGQAVPSPRQANGGRREGTRSDTRLPPYPSPLVNAGGSPPPALASFIWPSSREEVVAEGVVSRPGEDDGESDVLGSQALYERALALFEAGQSQDALEVLNREIGRAASARSHVLAARIYAGRGERALALANVESALRLDPLSAEAQFLRGLLQQQLEQATEAVASFERAIYIDPRTPLPHFHLADLYRRQGRKEEARREYRNTIRLLHTMPPDQLVGDFSAAFLLETCHRAQVELE